MRPFDRILAIDWSGAKHPVRKPGIAVAEAKAGEYPVYLRKGPWSRKDISSLIADMAGQGERVLVGIDANFSLAAICVDEVTDGGGAPDLWKKVDDLCRDEPDYFAGPLWQGSAMAHFFWCTGKMPVCFPPARRKTESACVQAGLGSPESPFKLVGAKQVGKGGLAAMRMVHDLKGDYGDSIAIWPFELDNLDGAEIVLCEIYPRLFLKMAGAGTTKIRDAEKLESVLQHLEARCDANTKPLSDHDSDALVSAAGMRYALARMSDMVFRPSGMDADTARKEGWIFGLAGPYRKG